MVKISRRAFLKMVAAGLGGAALNRFLAACSPSPGPEVLPTATTAPPTDTAVPTVTPSALEPRQVGPRPEIIQFYPAVPSKVVHTHHARAWVDESLDPAALREMVEVSITSLTGLDDAGEAWRALFRPTERIAIKVNAFRNSTIWTHTGLVQAVTEGLVQAGHPAEQIVIYDYSSKELETAGFQLNQEGPGVRCCGNDDLYQEGWQVDGVDVRLSSVLLSCDALINIPVLKRHMIAAMTYALKNHFGTVSNPSSLHGNIDIKIAGLNALPEIKDKTRLIIGDALEANLRYSGAYPYWEADWRGDSILMSYDPVAVDTMGAHILGTALEDDILISRALEGFDQAARLELGTNDPANIDLVEHTLG